MSEKENTKDHTRVDVEFKASKEELSLKAKGAGLLILLSISISGVIFMGYLMSKEGANSALMFPMMFLGYITYNLIATVDALLGITTRHHD